MFFLLVAMYILSKVHTYYAETVLMKDIYLKCLLEMNLEEHLSCITCFKTDRLD